jgi:hypothetical protein
MSFRRVILAYDNTLGVILLRVIILKVSAFSWWPTFIFETKQTFKTEVCSSVANITKLIWSKFTHNFDKLDRFLQAENLVYILCLSLA